MTKKEKKSEATPEELKQRMFDCEVKYHESFKGNSCSAIMSSYYDWQRAKKLYYMSIGRVPPETEKDSSDD